MSSARDLEHALLAAAQGTGELVRALGEHREEAPYFLDARREQRLVGEEIPAHAQVLVDRELRKHAVVLRHVGDAGGEDAVGREPEDVASLQPGNQIEHRLEKRRLARAVVPDDGDDLGLLDAQRHALEDAPAAVARAQASHFEHCRAHPRYASMTRGLACTACGLPRSSTAPWCITTISAASAMMNSMLCSTTR
jgi:hypothetical protein